MTKESKYLLDTIKSLLHNEPMSDEKASGFSDTIDYEKVFKLAKMNSIASKASYRICKDDSVPEDVREKFDLERMKITAQQIKQGIVISELKEIFNSYKLKGILLKGSIIKDFYPKSFMRSMSDIDIFMDEDDIKELCMEFDDRGFVTGVQGVGNHYEYSKYGVAKVEFHPELVSLDSEYGKKVFSRLFPEGKKVAEEMDLWNHTEPFEGSEFVRQLTPDYHYVYIVMHMMNHLLGSGTGIRSFIDVWVMNHHYGAQWNRAKLNELLDRFGLLRFEQYALALADKWFELDDKSCISMDIDEDVLDQLEMFILNSGTYGLWDNNMLKKMDHDTTGKSKIQYLLSTVFKPLDNMKNFYPILDKAPVLLPVMWVRRIFDLSTKKGRSSLNKLRSVVHADQEQADKVKSLFDKVI